MRPAVRAQRARRDQGRDRVARRHRAGRQGGRLRRLRRPTSPRSPRWPTARPSCSARSSARRASTPAPPSAYPCCRSTSPSRSSSSSRSRCLTLERIPLPQALVDQARAVRDRRGRARRAAPRGDGGAAARGRTSGPRSTCCGGRPRWRSPGGCASSPAAGSTRATTTRQRGVGGAVARRVGASGWAATSRWRAPWCVPRCGRRSRSPACCSPGPSDDSVVVGHDRRRLGGRPGRARVARAVDDRLPRTPRPGAAHRPARRVVGLADPGLRAAALRDVVLRRGAAGGAGDPRRLHRVVVGALDVRARGRRGGRGARRS